MAEPLGKIEKPEAKEFTSKKKLYLVPLLFSGKNAPEDYADKYRRYWQQVGEHVANLEEKLGKVGHIYHESVYEAGKNGLEAMQKLNKELIRNKIRVKLGEFYRPVIIAPFKFSKDQLNNYKRSVIIYHLLKVNSIHS